MSLNGHRLIHRLREVRMNEGVSIRTMTARTGLPASVLRRQEEEMDLSLSDFLVWQQALGVPFEELIDPRLEQVADHIRTRAGLIRVMKSVKTLLEQASLSQRQSIMVENIVNQLEEIMPELSDVDGWPQYGVRRSVSDLARIEAQVVSCQPGEEPYADSHLTAAS